MEKKHVKTMVFIDEFMVFRCFSDENHSILTNNTGLSTRKGFITRGLKIHQHYVPLKQHLVRGFSTATFDYQRVFFFNGEQHITKLPSAM